MLTTIATSTTRGNSLGVWTTLWLPHAAFFDAMVPYFYSIGAGCGGGGSEYDSCGDEERVQMIKLNDVVISHHRGVCQAAFRGHAQIVFICDNLMI